MRAETVKEQKIDFLALLPGTYIDRLAVVPFTVDTEPHFLPRKTVVYRAQK